MTTPPPAFRCIDAHTHLHSERLTRAIRRGFAEHSNWTLEYPGEPELVARFLRERGVECFVCFSYGHKAGMARETNETGVTNEDVVRWQDRMVFGSDFPNLPYPYENEREALWRRDLRMAVYPKIFRDNAARLLDV